MKSISDMRLTKIPRSSVDHEALETAKIVSGKRIHLAGIGHGQLAHLSGELSSHVDSAVVALEIFVHREGSWVVDSVGLGIAVLIKIVDIVAGHPVPVKGHLLHEKGAISIVSIGKVLGNDVSVLVDVHIVFVVTIQGGVVIQVRRTAVMKGIPVSENLN